VLTSVAASDIYKLTSLNKLVQTSKEADKQNNYGTILIRQRGGKYG
jgi:ribosomal protein L2